MALATWDSLLPSLAPLVHTAPDVSMRSALRQAATDFLGRTHLWRQVIDPIDTLVGEPNYELFADAAIASVLLLVHDGATLSQVAAERANAIDISRGRPTHYWRLADATVRLYPIPDAPGKLEGYVALKPASNASGIEDWIADSWGEAIVDGAAWSLMRVPGKVWSDDARALNHKMRFDRAISNARVHDTRRTDLRVKLRSF